MIQRCENSIAPNATCRIAPIQHHGATAAAALLTDDPVLPSDDVLPVDELELERVKFAGQYT